MASTPGPFAILPAALMIFAGIASCHPVKYDQRQEGELNFRADVEDVLFVVVPPKDMVSAGLSAVAATAANLLRKSYGGIEPERWSQKTAVKTGFSSPEKAPYRIDLGGKTGGIQKKKINHYGDPNRYNFHDGKIPVRSASTKIPSTEVESSSQSTTMTTTTTTTKVPEKQSETSTIVENKTVKKDLKKEEAEELKVAEEKKRLKEKETEKESSRKEETEKVAAEAKETEKELSKMRETEKVGAKTEKVAEEKVSPEAEVKVSKETEKEEGPRIVGEFSKGGLGPTSIFSHEGCGPDAYRDVRGVCVYKKQT